MASRSPVGERQRPVVRQEIAALAHRPDDVPASRTSPSRGRTGVDRMPRVVERGTQQVVHRGVDDREVLRGRPASGIRPASAARRRRRRGAGPARTAASRARPAKRPRTICRVVGERHRMSRRDSGCRGRRPGRRARAGCRRRAGGRPARAPCCAASRYGASSVICEPMWMSSAVDGDVRQRARRGGRAPARRRRRCRTCSPSSPVAMYGCVFGSTSGFTRKLTGATPARAAGDGVEARRARRRTRR